MTRSAINTGPGRVLLFLYALFAVAAGARAGVQIATKFSEAPVAYLLSAFAAVVYLVATVGFVRGDHGGRRLAMACLLIELAGVLVVGTIDVLWQPFPYTSVWSGYGAGYLYMPLILPLTGIVWMLRRTTREAYGARAGQSA